MWRVFFASAAGQRNLEQGEAGQDACHCLVEGDVLVAVVCDGAGSVLDGRSGSQFICRALAERLTNALLGDPLLTDLRSAGVLRLEAAIRDAIETVRAQLAEIAAARALALQEFSCTLVGCAVSRDGGCLFHIGDGFAILQDPAGDSVISGPENGEYADETYFVTDENWTQHLRITPLAAPGHGSLVGLMTDGTAPFAVNRARSGFFRPFIDPIAAFLAKATASNGNEALRNLLESPRACEISQDDKTLLLAFLSDR